MSHPLSGLIGLRRFLRLRSGRWGAALLALVIVVALFAPLLAPGDPLSIVGKPLVPPLSDWRFILGTDRLGRDVFAQLVHGAGGTLLLGGTSALAAIGLGTMVGATAGYAGGWLDEALMRVTEAFQTVPGFVLCLSLIAVLGPAQEHIVMAIALSSWTASARVVRAQILSLKRRDYVDAYRVLGMSPWRIALVEVLPNAMTPVVSLAAVVVAAAVLIEAALAFLGLGDPNRASWGAMIAEGRTVLRSAWYLAAIPGGAVVITVLGVSLIGEALSGAFSSRRRRP